MKDYSIYKNQNFFLNHLIFFLISSIPISIILGPAVSLTVILVICLSYLIINLKITYSFYLKKKEVILLFTLYFYLLLNSAISIDPSISIDRNFGFIRFIIFFLATNFLFYKYSNSNKIFKYWSIIFIIFVIDVFIERYTGSNIFGFGKIMIDGISQPDGSRVMSFFKDEPISGAFMTGFIFIISGYFFSIFEKKNYNKIYPLLLILIFIFAILITGERSNFLKVLFGFFLFILITDFIQLRKKFLFLIILITVFIGSMIFSDYIKLRYYKQIYLSLVDKEKREKFMNHFYIKLYKSGFAVYKNYPFLGVGNKNYRVETCNPKKKEKNLKYDCSTHPHQVYFELLSEHGIIGTLIILSVLFYLIFRMLRHIFLSKNYIQAGAFTYLVINFIPILPGGAFFNDFNLTLFMINFSIMYAINKDTNIFNN